MAKHYINQNHVKSVVLRACGLSRSGYYRTYKTLPLVQGKGNQLSPRAGRPFPGHSLNLKAELVFDSTILKILEAYREQKEFQNWGGYKVLSRYLLRDHGLRVNAKKVYRLCQESGLLLPRAKKKRRKYEKICVNRRVNGPNQLWEFDIKQGVIHGENRAFYFLAFIDVFVREIVGYHIGLSCRAIHLKMALNEALKRQGLGKDNRLVIRSDNGTQMTSHQFRKHVEELGIHHEFTPFSCPEKNAHIEAFFSLYEVEFLQTRYFGTFREVVERTMDFIDFYHKRRLHGSLFYLPPFEFKKRHQKGHFQDFSVSL